MASISEPAMAIAAAAQAPSRVPIGLGDEIVRVCVCVAAGMRHDFAIISTIIIIIIIIIIILIIILIIIFIVIAIIIICGH